MFFDFNVQNKSVHLIRNESSNEKNQSRNKET